MTKLKRRKGERLCGDEITTTYGTIKLAQNEAFREGIAYVIAFLEGRDQPYTAMVVREQISEATLYDLPRCDCDAHLNLEAVK